MDEAKERQKWEMCEARTGTITNYSEIAVFVCLYLCCSCLIAQRPACHIFSGQQRRNTQASSEQAAQE